MLRELSFVTEAPRSIISSLWLFCLTLRIVNSVGGNGHSRRETGAVQNSTELPTPGANSTRIIAARSGPRHTSFVPRGCSESANGKTEVVVSSESMCRDHTIRITRSLASGSTEELGTERS
ncbi:uncharacterized protein B0H18DRAFT_150258 [Fomitopsis serialis]|uniref:uncharacterized protein n=1 Tax=Fomitopsis serialis TaxID=139415 RepID=UPI00200873F5|nr:uncharacterized protein B0H18DRAFT_150258 [Neoantrodia serialis]KAH9914031.1 hypothetical protein B0H18DRAFT_150258 [Neoantrodia serialis]